MGARWKREAALVDALARFGWRAALGLIAAASCVMALALAWSAQRNRFAEIAPASVSAVSAGFEHSLLVGADGSVWGWGGNSFGQVNADRRLRSCVPVRVNGISGAVAAAAGNTFSMALISDGTVRQWGTLDDILGEAAYLGVPTSVPGLPRVRAISAGARHLMALCDDGTVWTWGQNKEWQLGGGTADHRAVPSIVEGLSDIVAIDAGPYSCISLKADGTVWTWGYRSVSDDSGGVIRLCQRVPAMTEIPGRAVSVAAGYSHYLVVLSDGEVWAWGGNYNSQVGRTGPLCERPLRVQGLPPCETVSAGDDFSLALGRDGSVWAWGGNNYGQLGLGYRRRSVGLEKVERLSGIVSIAAGTYHAVAVGADGTVWELGAVRRLFPFGADREMLWPIRVNTERTGIRLIP